MEEPGRVIGQQVRPELGVRERVGEREKETIFTKPPPPLEREGGKWRMEDGGREGNGGWREGGRVLDKERK